MAITPSKPMSAGYIVEIPYTAHYYPEASPGRMRQAASWRGRRGLPPAAGFSMLELGCGYGLNTILAAAANPDAICHAIDFNAEHIASARQLATAAGIGNASFFDLSFADFLKQPGVRQYDYILVHGVISWVPPAVWGQVVEILDRCLKPGGLAFVSYNTVTGNAAMLPVREFMAAWSAAGEGSLPEKFAASRQYLGRLAAAGGGFFAANPAVAKRLEAMAQQDQAYLVHEYLNEHWQPFSHTDVSGTLAKIGLEFAGSGNLYENVDRLCWPPETRALAAEVKSPALRELLKELCLNKTFRRDLYVRPAPVPAEQPDPELPFSLVVPRAACNTAESLPSGKLSLGPACLAMLDALAAGPLTREQLQQLPIFLGHGKAGAEVEAGLQNLCSVSYVAPSRPPPAPGAADACRRLNRLLLEMRLGQDGTVPLASPVLGAGVVLPKADAVLLRSHLRGEPDHIASLIDLWPRISPPLAETPPTPEQWREAVIQFMADRLPLYRHLGLV